MLADQKKRLTLVISFDNISLSDIASGDGESNGWHYRFNLFDFISAFKAKHGYLIMKQIHELSQGTFWLVHNDVYDFKEATKRGGSI